MKKLLILLAPVLMAGAAQAADIGVSVHIGQPGFYGRIDIGNTAPPPVIVAQPVWVQRGPALVPPVYMRVPPGHQKNWRKHCARYNACGVPVYFVREEWYQDRYERPYLERHPAARQDHRGDRGPRHAAPAQGPQRQHGRQDSHGKHDKGHDKGHGKGHGNDKGHGQGRGRD